MRYKWIGLAVVIIAALSGALLVFRGSESQQAPIGELPVTPLNQPMSLTFSDEFRKFDRSIWTPALAHYGESYPEGELQHYRPEEVSLLPEGGLRLSSSQRTFEGKHITAGAINSSDGFAQTYGHFEIKAKLAGGPGTWPAFWLMPNDSAWPPEIDIFEYLGRMPRSIHVNTVDKDAKGNRVDYGDYVRLGFNPSEDYHVYALDWRPDVLIWSIDGKEVYRQTKGIPHRPMYVILNLAYGGSWAGPVTRDTPFPGQYDIKYVRVYQFDDLKGQGAVPYMQFSKLQLETRNYKPGDTIPVSAQVKIGQASVKALKVNVTIVNFSGARTIVSDTVALGDAPAHAVVPFKTDLRLPAKLEDGLYNVTLIAEVAEPVFDPSRQSMQARIYRGIADQFEVAQ